MILSAIASSEGGTVKPSVLAAFRLMTSLKWVGCSIGKSPDFAPFTVLSTYPVAEYLAGLEAEAQVQEDGDSRDGGSDGKPIAKPDRKRPKVISSSDPSSAWTAKANKRVQFGYGINYLVDVEPSIIVDVEATPARTYDEAASTKTMIEGTERRFDLKPDWLAADTA